MSRFEPEAERIGGSENYKAAISTAVSAKRTADTLERIETLLLALQSPPAKVEG